MYLRKMTLGLILVSTLFSSCGNVTKPNPNNRNYEDAYRSSSTVTSTVEENPYIDNHLQTGAVPYDNASLYGSSSTITVSTSVNSECDVVVIIKHNGNIVRNAYILAGDLFLMGLIRCSFMEEEVGIQIKKWQEEILVVL